MKKIIVLILGVILISFLVFASFRYYSINQQREKNKIVVGATIGALAAILKEIAKDRVEIINLSEGFVHAHEIELKPEQIRKLTNAKVIFSIGYGIDDWVKKINKENSVEIFEVSSGANLINDNKKVNPHYWLSLNNSKIIALNITKKLSEIDSPNKNFYLKNLNQFYQNIEELKKVADEIKKLDNRKIIITHPSFDYLAKETNLEVIGYLMTEEGEGISAKEFLDLAQAVKRYNLKVIFAEKGFEDPTVQQFANLYKLNLVIIDPLEVTTGDALFTTVMRENLNRIYNNLK